MHSSLQEIRRTPVDFIHECQAGLEQFSPPPSQRDDYQELGHVLDCYSASKDGMTFPDLMGIVQKIWALQAQRFVGSMRGAQAYFYPANYLCLPCESPLVGNSHNPFRKGGFPLSELYQWVCEHPLRGSFVEVVAPLVHFEASIRMSIAGMSYLGNPINSFARLMGDYVLLQRDLMRVDVLFSKIRFRIPSPTTLFQYMRAEKMWEMKRPVFTFRQPLRGYEVSFLERLSCWPLPICFQGTNVHDIRYAIPQFPTYIHLDPLFVLYAGLEALYGHSEG